MVINTITQNIPPSDRSTVASPSGGAPAEQAVTTQQVAGPQGRQGLPAASEGMPPQGGSAAQSAQELEEAVSALSSRVQVVQRDLQFSIDDDSGQTIVKVIDSATEEVIRQIPPEELLALVKNLRDASGMLLEREA